MSELEPKLSIAPVGHTPTRNIPPGSIVSRDSFNYNPSYVSPGSLGNSSSFQSRSLTSSDESKANGIGKCKRPRKARSIFSSEQLKILNDEFERHNYINNYTREDLANRAGITPEQVKIWFQNMRSKRRKSFDKATPQYHVGLDYANLQQYANISSMIPPGQIIPAHFMRSQIPFTNHSALAASTGLPTPTTSANYSGSNSSNSSTTFTFVTPNGPRVTNGNPVNVNINNSAGTNQPAMYWDASNKHPQVKLNKSGGFAPSNNNPLPLNTNQQASFVGQSGQPTQFYPIKNSRDIPGINTAITNHMQISSGSNKSSTTFIAPGFASTLYNAKLTNEGKTMANDCNLAKQTKSSSGFLLNRPSNIPISSDSKGGQSTTSKPYVTSTPQQHRTASQLNPNFYSSSLPPFATSATIGCPPKPKFCSSNSAAPSNNNTTTQVHPHQSSSSNAKPNI